MLPGASIHEELLTVFGSAIQTAFPGNALLTVLASLAL